MLVDLSKIKEGWTRFTFEASPLAWIGYTTGNIIGFLFEPGELVKEIEKNVLAVARSLEPPFWHVIDMITDDSRTPASDDDPLAPDINDQGGNHAAKNLAQLH